MNSDQNEVDMETTKSQEPPIAFYHPFGNPIEDTRPSHTDFEQHEFGARRSR